MKCATLRFVGLWLGPLAACAAQPAAAPTPPAATASAPAASSGAAPVAAQSATPGAQGALREPIEPNVQHIVVVGENTRVDELRVRGQTQSVTVTTRDGARYEMVVGDNSRDLSSNGSAQKGAAGQRVWRLLSF